MRPQTVEGHEQTAGTLPATSAQQSAQAESSSSVPIGPHEAANLDGPTYMIDKHWWLKEMLQSLRHRHDTAKPHYVAEDLRGQILKWTKYADEWLAQSYERLKHTATASKSQNSAGSNIDAGPNELTHMDRQYMQLRENLAAIAEQRELNIKYFRASRQTELQSEWFKLAENWLERSDRWLRQPPVALDANSEESTSPTQSGYSKGELQCAVLFLSFFCSILLSTLEQNLFVKANSYFPPPWLTILYFFNAHLMVSRVIDVVINGVDVELLGNKILGQFLACIFTFMSVMSMFDWLSYQQTVAKLVVLALTAYLYGSDDENACRNGFFACVHGVKRLLEIVKDS